MIRGGVMPRPPIDGEAMRALAVRMAGASPDARRKLRRFIKGEMTYVDALPVFREAVRELLGLDDMWSGKNVGKQLRADLNEWGVMHGTGRASRSGEATTKNVAFRCSPDEVDAYEEAAKAEGLNRSEFLRQAANVAVERLRAAKEAEKAAASTAA
jgi:hypothetical protein